MFPHYISHKGRKVSQLWNSNIIHWKHSQHELQNLAWPYQLFHWKTFTVANQSSKTTKFPPQTI